MKILTNNQQVVLASKSPIRAELLKKYGLNIKVIDHQVNEEQVKKNHKFKLNLLSDFLAIEKVKSIKHLFRKQKIVASDQILICDNKLMNKPKSKKEAIKNLLFLQNKKHTLISSICLLNEEGKYLLHTDKAIMFMKKVSKRKIYNYISNNEDIVFSTVGSYKIEDDKLNCLTIIKGNMETVLGFPISKFLPILKKNI